MDVMVAATQLREFFGDHAVVRASEPEGVTLMLGGGASGYALNTEHDKLVLHLWTSERSLVRRVVAVAAERRALALQCTRFGQSRATPLYLESGEETSRALNRGPRSEFQSRLRAALRRAWPGARIVPGVAGTELPEAQHQCILLREGRHQAACVAAAPDEPQAVLDATLTRLLLWADTIQMRLPGSLLSGRRVILPAGRHATVRARMSCMRDRLGWELYEYDARRPRHAPLDLTRVEIHDGNLESRLRRAVGTSPELSPEAAALLERMRSLCPSIAPTWDAEGMTHFRVHGLECVRQARLHESLLAPFVYGVGGEATPLTAAAWPDFERWLRQLSLQRRSDSEERTFWYRLRAEDWMEELLRRDLSQVEPLCDARYVYSQVPVCAGVQRDVLDLLAVRRDGVLCVMELKAEENLGFPLQGLDYWLRVRRHQQQGDFERLGYFPGVRLNPASPVLYLVAPALRWHPRSDILLRAIRPEIPVLRLGLNEEWRRGIRVLEMRGG